MGKIEEEPPMEGAPTWITTFVDMTSLLVTFFILLFTFSSIQEYDSFTHKENFLGTRGVIDSDGGTDMEEPPDEDIMSAMDVERGASIPHVRPPESLDENMAEMGQMIGPDHIQIDPKEFRDGLRVRYGPESAFAPGSAEVPPPLARRLRELARVLQHYPFMVAVEGHTDGAFQPTARYPDELSLSTARAVAAAEVMLASSNLSPRLIQVAGLGSTRPLGSGDTALDRALERRVEIQILSIPQALSERLTERGF